ncbi:MAG: hypothetical protein JWO19_2272 [Bryobacterales bacterium]|nr:hypothetical protein [Bryobacterales bacterium]
MLLDIQKRVLNAKYVLERASRMQEETGEMSLAISVLLMHDAVELLMLAVLDHLGISPKKNREFMDFWPLVRDAGKPEPPDRIPMDSLNKLRVGFKHYGNVPNPQVVRDLLPRVRGFFENVLQAYCSVSYPDISLLDLIPDSEVRSLLRDGQAKFASDKAGALTDLKIALYKLQNPVGKKLAFLQAPPEPRLSGDIARAGWGNYLSQLHSFLGQLTARANASMLGVDPVRYAAFVRQTPNINWSYSGKPEVIHTGTYQHISENAFDEMVAFLIDYALKANEAYIPNPSKASPPGRPADEQTA